VYSLLFPEKKGVYQVDSRNSNLKLWLIGSVFHGLGWGINLTVVLNPGSGNGMGVGEVL
jgi:hypothetical protein